MAARSSVAALDHPQYCPAKDQQKALHVGVDDEVAGVPSPSQPPEWFLLLQGLHQPHTGIGADELLGFFGDHIFVEMAVGLPLRNFEVDEGTPETSS